MSGRSGSGGLWWVVDRGEEGLPVLLPGPVRRQVEQDAAGSVRDPGRDVDQLSADGRGAGLGVARAGQAAGGAGEVVCHGGEGEPGGVGGEPARRQVGEGSVDEIGEDLFDDGVVAVSLVGGDGGQVGVGQEGVVAPGWEQFFLTGRCGVRLDATVWLATRSNKVAL